MKTSRIALGVALCFGAIAALPAQTPGWEQYLDQVRIKKAIADQLTPEQLEERRIRLAQWLAERAANAQTPNTPTGGPAHDTCPTTPYATGAFPFSVSDTTVGLVDDYDLPADTTDPTCTAPTTCTGGASSGSGPRGAIYTGTGTGADAAYKIRTDANCTLEITVDPTSTQDLAGILYQTQCSSSLADCGCVADTGVGGTAEVITLDAVAGTDYFVSADGYSTGATPPGPSGPYTVSVAVTSGSCNLTGGASADLSITKTDGVRRRMGLPASPQGHRRLTRLSQAMPVRPASQGRRLRILSQRVAPACHGAALLRVAQPAPPQGRETSTTRSTYQWVAPLLTAQPAQ